MAIYLAPLGVSGQNVQTLAISNTFTYGGIGGTQATTSGGSPQGPLISTHELGHSLGTLAEYAFDRVRREVLSAVGSTRKSCACHGSPIDFKETCAMSRPFGLRSAVNGWPELSISQTPTSFPNRSP